jgi:hypothetical protein
MLRSVLAVLLLAVPLAAQGVVHVVDDNGPADFPYVQDAINAAADGDTILVRPGGQVNTYRFTIDGKSLSIIADGTGTVACGAIGDFHSSNNMVDPNSLHNVVRNLGPDQVVVLRGLSMRGLEVEDVAGQVWVQSCTISTTAPTLRAEGVARLVLRDCQLAAPDGFVDASYTTFVNAGVGLDALDSGLAVEGCTIEGGDGIDFVNTILGGVVENENGRDALRLTGGSLWLANSTLTGGTGGTAGCFLTCPDGANGGSGLHLLTGSPTVWSLGNQFTGGAGGNAAPMAPPGTSEPGLPGLPTVIGSGSVETLAGTPRSLSISSPVVEGGSVSLRLGGEPGEFVLVLLGLQPTLLPLPLRLGALQVSPPWTIFSIAALPASGKLTLQAPIAELGGALETAQLFVQGLYCSGGCVLGPASALSLFDSQF